MLPYPLAPQCGGARRAPLRGAFSGPSPCLAVDSSAETSFHPFSPYHGPRAERAHRRRDFRVGYAARVLHQPLLTPSPGRVERDRVSPVRQTPVAMLQGVVLLKAVDVAPSDRLSRQAREIAPSVNRDGAAAQTAAV
jgi:hypothetical protein